MSSEPAVLDRLKNQARRAARHRRRALSEPIRAAASVTISERLVAVLEAWRSRDAVAAFWPLADEVDLRAFMQAWHALGRTVLLPRMQGSARPLRFGPWTPATVLDKGPFGVLEPPDPGELESLPDVVLVPLLAADDRGYRLGYGGGFYDRTLAALDPVPAIGVAFEAQRVPRLPLGPHDRRLTHLMTESTFTTFGGGAEA